MNTIEKQKTALKTIAILALIFGVLIFIGAVAMIVGGAISLVNKNWVAGALLLVFGVILVLVGGFLTIWGIRWVWVGSALVATKGSVAQDNSIAQNSVNSIKCPNCGATNVGSNTECSVCHTSFVEVPKAE